jgi:cell wall-associated NlpC family hydrolase
MNLALYQSVPYKDGGRVVSADPELNGLDCFGLVRHALHYQFGGPLLDSFSGIFRADHSEMTTEFNAALENKSHGGFELCSPQAGAIACCFHKTANGDVFHHVGICIDESSVMHTSERHGYAAPPVRVFKRLSGKVEFYKFVNDCSNSENE